MMSFLYYGFIGLCLAMVSYVAYYILKVVKKPIFVCKNPKLREFITNNMPILAQRYWPTIWCFQGQIQTLIQGLINEFKYIDPGALPYRREMLSTPDGGEVSLDWVDNDEGSPFETAERPTVIIIPGLAGSSEESYIRLMVKASTDLGYRTVVFNNRGMGQLKLKTPRTFAMCNPEDTRTVISHIKDTYPLAPLIAEGFSAGAVTLFHYMEHYGEDCHLIGTIMVSVLFDGFDSTRSIETFPNIKIFNAPLARCLLDTLVIPNLEILRQHEDLDIDSILQIRTLRQYHARVATPMFGYKDWKEFYSDCTINDKMHKIKVPTLILNAADDPFAPQDSIPMEEIKKQDNIVLALTSHGGHNGFLQGLIPTGISYDVQVFAQFISAFFRQKDCYTFSNNKHEVNSNRVD